MAKSSGHWTRDTPFGPIIHPKEMYFAPLLVEGESVLIANRSISTDLRGTASTVKIVHRRRRVRSTANLLVRRRRCVWFTANSSVLRRRRAYFTNACVRPPTPQRLPVTPPTMPAHAHRRRSHNPRPPPERRHAHRSVVLSQDLRGRQWSVVTP